MLESSDHRGNFGGRLVNSDDGRILRVELQRCHNAGADKVNFVVLHDEERLSGQEDEDGKEGQHLAQCEDFPGCMSLIVWACLPLVAFVCFVLWGNETSRVWALSLFV
jgi:hypothetical protein